MELAPGTFQDDKCWDLAAHTSFKKFGFPIENIIYNLILEYLGILDKIELKIYRRFNLYKYVYDIGNTCIKHVDPL